MHAERNKSIKDYYRYNKSDKLDNTQSSLHSFPLTSECPPTFATYEDKCLKIFKGPFAHNDCGRYSWSSKARNMRPDGPIEKYTMQAMIGWESSKIQSYFYTSVFRKPAFQFINTYKYSRKWSIGHWVLAGIRGCCIKM